MKVADRPWMAEAEIEIVDSIFRALRPRRVLEWGAGGSTLYFPQRYGFVESWIAVEHDAAFAEAVLARAAGKVEVLQLDEPGYWKQPRRLGKFDLIIVDGMYRVECLKVARGILEEGGVVILHDSGRSAYNEAWKLWPGSEELYPGEKPTGDGYFKHRGITVFWYGEVERGGWCRKYQVEPLGRPEYKPPRRRGRNSECGIRNAE